MIAELNFSKVFLTKWFEQYIYLDLVVYWFYRINVPKNWRCVSICFLWRILFWLERCQCAMEVKYLVYLFFFLVEWNKEYFPLEIFKEKLLTLNQVATFLSSSFIVSKRFAILGSEINKSVSSANITGVSLLEFLKRSLIYMRSKSGSRMEPCIAPQVLLRHMLFSYLPSDANCCWCFK